jgi:hypothetical protein
MKQKLLKVIKAQDRGLFQELQQVNAFQRITKQAAPWN